MTSSSVNLKQALPSMRLIVTRFAPQIRRQRWLLSGSFVALLLETGLRLLDPWPLKFIFDELILKGFDTSTSSIALLRNTSPITFLVLHEFVEDRFTTVATVEG